MFRKMLIMLIAAAFIFTAAGAFAGTLFFDDFQSGNLAGWTGKSGDDAAHHGILVDDPLAPQSGNKVLSFTETNLGGDIFTESAFSSSSGYYLLSFDYLGKRPENAQYQIPSGGLGGFIGLSQAFPGGHDWIAGTDASANPDYLIEDVEDAWQHYEFVIQLSGDLHVMLEDFYTSGYGVLDYAGDVYFDNVKLSSVPVPAAVWLLGSGLVGLFGVRRKAGR